MTTHVYSDWKWGDHINQFPFDQVVNAIESHGRKQPQAFALLHPADSFVLVVGMFLSQEGAREDIGEYVPEGISHREDAIKIFNLILDRLDETP